MSLQGISNNNKRVRAPASFRRPLALAPGSAANGKRKADDAVLSPPLKPLGRFDPSRGILVNFVADRMRTFELMTIYNDAAGSRSTIEEESGARRFQRPAPDKKLVERALEKTEVLRKARVELNSDPTREGSAANEADGPGEASIAAIFQGLSIWDANTRTSLAFAEEESRVNAELRRLQQVEQEYKILRENEDIREKARIANVQELDSLKLQLDQLRQSTISTQLHTQQLTELQTKLDTSRKSHLEYRQQTFNMYGASGAKRYREERNEARESLAECEKERDEAVDREATSLGNYNDLQTRHDQLRKDMESATKTKTPAIDDGLAARYKQAQADLAQQVKDQHDLHVMHSESLRDYGALQSRYNLLEKNLSQAEQRANTAESNVHISAEQLTTLAQLTGENQVLREKLDRRKQKVVDAREELRETAEKLTLHEKSANTASAKARIVKDDILGKAARQHAMLTAQVGAKEVELQRLRQVEAQLTRKIEDLVRSQRHTTVTACQGFQRFRAHLNASNLGQIALAVVFQETSGRTAQLDVQFESLSIKLGLQIEEVQRLGTELTTSQNELSQRNKQVSNHLETIGRLEAEQHSLSLQKHQAVVACNTLEMNLQEQLGTRSSLASELSEATMELSSVRNENAAHLQRIADLRTTERGLNRELNTHREAVISLKEHNAAVAAELNRAAQTHLESIQAFRADRLTYEEAVTAQANLLHQELAKSNTNADALLAAKTDAEDRLNEVLGIVSTLNMELSILKTVFQAELSDVVICSLVRQHVPRVTSVRRYRNEGRVSVTTFDEDGRNNAWNGSDGQCKVDYNRRCWLLMEYGKDPKVQFEIDAADYTAIKQLLPAEK